MAIDYDNLVPNYTIETALLNGDIDDMTTQCVMKCLSV